MRSKETEARFSKLAEEVFAGYREWRVDHPKATLQEIELAADERLAKLRAQMVEDAALASAAADIGWLEEEKRPRCPDCGEILKPYGQQTRCLVTNYNQSIALKRSHVLCPKCGKGFFPPR